MNTRHKQDVKYPNLKNAAAKCPLLYSKAISARPTFPQLNEAAIALSLASINSDRQNGNLAVAEFFFFMNVAYIFVASHQLLLLQIIRALIR